MNFAALGWFELLLRASETFCPGSFKSAMNQDMRVNRFKVGDQGLAKPSTAKHCLGV